MSRLWPNGEPIHVTLDEAGAPCSFTWAGAAHSVERIANRWRVDEAWWTARVWRDYFKLTTEAGWLVIVYHDLTNDFWYLQRVYD